MKFFTVLVELIYFKCSFKVQAKLQLNRVKNKLKHKSLVF